MGEKYNRLQSVHGLDFHEQDDLDLQNAVVELLAEVKQRTTQFIENPAMTGKAADTAVAWLKTYETDLNQAGEEITTIVSHFSAAISAMNEAKSAFAALPTELMTAAEEQAIRDKVGPNDGGLADQAIMAQKAALEQKREADADAILATMNAAVNQETQAILVPPSIQKQPKPPTGDDNPPSSTGGGVTIGGSGGKSGSSSTSLSLGAGSSSLDLASFTSNSSGFTSPGLSTGDGAYGSYGLAPSGGGGQWSDTYHPSVLSGDLGISNPGAGSGGLSGATAGAVVGGILGIGGAALAARALGGGMSGASALAFQSATGSGSAAGLGGMNSSAYGAGRVPGGGMLRGAAAGAARTAGVGPAGSGRGFGAGAAQSGSGRVGATQSTTGRGLAGRSAAGRAGATQAASGKAGDVRGAAGRGTSGRAGAAEAEAGRSTGRGRGPSSRGTNGRLGAAETEAARNGSRDNRGLGARSDKGKGRRKKDEAIDLVGYEVDRLETEDFDVVAGPGANPGDSSSLAPLTDPDAGDRW